MLVSKSTGQWPLMLHAGCGDLNVQVKREELQPAQDTLHI
jgi:hypothetical protein